MLEEIEGKANEIDCSLQTARLILKLEKRLLKLEERLSSLEESVDVQIGRLIEQTDRTQSVLQDSLEKQWEAGL